MHPAGLLGAEPCREGDLSWGLRGRGTGVGPSASPSQASSAALDVLEAGSIFQASGEPQVSLVL